MPEGMTTILVVDLRDGAIICDADLQGHRIRTSGSDDVNVKQQNTSRMKLLSRSFIAWDAAEPF